MRILFVAMAESIHTVRWMNQLADQGWDIHLFPVGAAGIHPNLRNVTVHNLLSYRMQGPDWGSGRIGSSAFSRGAGLARRVFRQLVPSWLGDCSQLARTIRRVKPDIVNSLEMQNAGYLTLAARERLGGDFPTWIMSVWGSDIFLFGRLREHLPRVKAVLSACDYLACECRRDEELARRLGFNGAFLTRLPMWGGVDTSWVRQFRKPGPTSSRRLIVLKGYQGWAGRALVGLHAIELTADALKDYSVAIYLAGEDVSIAAELVSQRTGLPIEIVPRSPHEDILRLHGQARVSIGLSISDGLPASMVEAMAMGSFPIQSDTSCAGEWLVDGRNGFVVPPEDPELIAAAIYRAVTDDLLVDNAAERNAEIVSKRLEYADIQSEAIKVYERVAAQGKVRAGTKGG